MYQHNHKTCMPDLAHTTRAFNWLKSFDPESGEDISDPISETAWRMVWEENLSKATTESRIAEAQEAFGDRLEKHDSNMDGILDASEITLAPNHPLHAA